MRRRLVPPQREILDPPLDTCTYKLQTKGNHSCFYNYIHSTSNNVIYLDLNYILSVVTLLRRYNRTCNMRHPVLHGSSRQSTYQNMPVLIDTLLYATILAQNAGVVYDRFHIMLQIHIKFCIFLF